MKPLRLTLNAVGPYPGCEIIDFRAVLESRLFGIYGPTGAGKSTIFSAMTFALFGEATRDEQHPSTLRSDHADPSRMTEVEFVFETGNRIFRIVRSPEQIRPAKRGSGDTKEPHRATLFDVTGLDLDQIGDALPGKVVAEKKVDSVNKAIMNLLGYGSTQFRQIVLLPQGRFEAFLTASTPDRVKILRELFDVSLYRRLTDEVKSRADDAENEVRNARDVCAGRLAAEGFATGAELEAGIATANEELRVRRETLVILKEALDAATQKYQAAASTDQAFTEHFAADKAFNIIKAESDTIEGLRKRGARARSAQLLADADQAITSAYAHVQAMARGATKAAEDLAAAEVKANDAALALQILVTKGPEHEADKVQHQRCLGFSERLDACGPLRANYNESLAKAAADAKRAEYSLSLHTDLGRQQSEISKQLDLARRNQLRRTEIGKQAAEANSQLQAARLYERGRNQIALDEADVERLGIEAEKANSALIQREAAFNKAEAALIQDHALHIAARLVEGEPCPACGSSDHPAPARGDVSENSLSEVYQRAKAAFDSARKLADEARTNLSVANNALISRREELNALSVPELPAKTIEGQLATLMAEKKALGPEIDIGELETKLSKLATALATAQTTFLTDQTAATASDKQAALALQALDNALQTIPESLRDATTLSACLSELSRKISAYVGALQKAQETELKMREALASAKTAGENAVRNHKHADEQLIGAKAAFSKRLAEAGLSEDDYTQGKADIPLLAEMDKKISDYHDRYIRAEERLIKASTTIQNVDRPDIKALLDARNEAEKGHQIGSDAVAAANARLQQLTKLAKELSDELARLNRLEKETAPLRELADAFSGRNDAKIELETFAIATMFDRVLEAANLRYGPMSRNRYSLVRESEGRGNARRGLGLCVEDAYTGRQRPTSTLSGGETFMAALSLALGLSDIVESTTGSIRLDTIFIDEGFGSLDTDGDAGTLEQVLETLQTVVGQNRTVGVISHVPLVQQAIPNGFWITKTASGSRIEVRT
jgi:exonuclease SbcC